MQGLHPVGSVTAHGDGCMEGNWWAATVKVEDCRIPIYPFKEWDVFLHLILVPPGHSWTSGMHKDPPLPGTDLPEQGERGCLTVNEMLYPRYHLLWPQTLQDNLLPHSPDCLFKP